MIPSPSGPSASSPAAPQRSAPQPCSTSSRPRRPSRSRASRWTEDRSSGPNSKRPVHPVTSPSSSCRPRGPSSTDMSSGPRDHGAMSSMPPTTCPAGSIVSSLSSTPSPIVSTTIDLIRPLADEPQPSTSQPAARKPARLICPEPGHGLDVAVEVHHRPRGAVPELAALRVHAQKRELWVVLAVGEPRPQRLRPLLLDPPLVADDLSSLPLRRSGDNGRPAVWFARAGVVEARRRSVRELAGLLGPPGPYAL